MLLNNSGIFTIVLVLIFLQFLAVFIAVEIDILEKFYDYKNLSIKIEKATYVRAELERNFDKTIKNILCDELAKNNSSHEEVEWRIANAIVKFAEEYEKKRNLNPKLSFWLEDYIPGQKYSEIECGKNGEKIISLTLKNHLTVIISPPVEGKPPLITFSYNSGIPPKIICAKIEMKDISTQFFVPHNYMQIITLTAAGECVG